MAAMATSPHVAIWLVLSTVKSRMGLKSSHWATRLGRELRPLFQTIQHDMTQKGISIPSMEADSVRPDSDCSCVAVSSHMTGTKYNMRMSAMAAIPSSVYA